MALALWSSAAFGFPLPDGHRFPLTKYTLLRDTLRSHAHAVRWNIGIPPAAPDEALRLVHSAEYLTAMTDGTLSPAAVRRMGFPWSAELVERSRRAVGGTLAAAEHALANGVAMNLAGGTHHAFADYGEGFCVFNDVAVSIRLLQQRKLVQRALVVDLDVHQGNGTNAIFAHDERVYTFSMHGRRNFPFNKVAGSLDVELEDGVGDEEYLTLLADALPRALHAARADIVYYLAGADPHEGDRLGRLALSFDGLRRRDVMVFDACREIGLPVVTTIAGGYGRVIEDTVAVHVATVEVLSRY